MIEEVGSTYVNAFIEEKSYEPNETSVGEVLDDIRTEYAGSDEFDLRAIDDLVLDARNEVAHYITRRKNVVSVNKFEEFYLAVIEGIELVDELLGELMNQPLTDFEKGLEKIQV